MNEKSEIEVTFQTEGSHYWKDAPAEVCFLRSNHRHMFHFTVRVEMTHDDRDIEFFMMKRKMLSWYGAFTAFGPQSCEMIARDLAGRIVAEYGERNLQIKVSEDGENAGIYTRTLS